MVWREAEVIAGAMRLLWYPLKLVWNMLKALRLAWRDIRNPASAAFVDAIQLVAWTIDEDLPPGLDIIVSVFNASSMTLELRYKSGRLRFQGLDLSGSIDEREPVSCPSRKCRAIWLKQWVSKEEAKRIRECDDPKVWDASHMRFVVRGTGLLAERALRMPKDIHTTGPAIHTWRGLAGAKKSD